MLKAIVPVLLPAALLCLNPAALCAQEDAEGGKDHPLFSRLPGYYIDVYEDRDFDACELKVGRDKSVTVAGRMVRISYYAKQGVKAPIPGFPTSTTTITARSKRTGRSATATSCGSTTMQRGSHT